MPWLLDLLFPKKCVGCGKFGKYVCEACEVGLWEEEQLFITKKPDGLDGLTNLWAYEGLAKKIIQKAKYKYFYDTLSELIKPEKLEQLGQFDCIVPVPLYSKREHKRGFNQAKIIAQVVSKLLKVPIVDLLVRIKDTGHQVGRTRAERLEAMNGAFSLNTEHRISNSILLVDDVWTTGATMNECCKILKKGGVQKVWGLVLAR